MQPSPNAVYPGEYGQYYDPNSAYQLAPGSQGPYNPAEMSYDPYSGYPASPYPPGAGGYPAPMPQGYPAPMPQGYPAPMPQGYPAPMPQGYPAVYPNSYPGGAYPPSYPQQPQQQVIVINQGNNENVQQVQPQRQNCCLNGDWLPCMQAACVTCGQIVCCICCFGVAMLGMGDERNRR